MNKTITVDIFSGNGIDTLQRAVEAEAKRLRDGMKVLVRLAADEGKNEAQANFANAQYDGTQGQDTVEVIPGGSDTEATVRASGPTAHFIEFGTGVFYPDNYPEPVGRGKRGTYGKGYGKNPRGWHYKGSKGSQGFLEDADTSTKWNGWVYTVGNPANAPMYESKKKLLDETRRLVNEAFGE